VTRPQTSAAVLTTIISATALSELAHRKHYLSELSLVRLREARREAEQDQLVPSSLYEEVRQRNRLDRLRRACRHDSRMDNDVTERHLLSVTCYVVISPRCP